MRAEGYITEAERRAAEAEPLPAAPSLPESIVGPYFCEEIRQYLEKTYGEKDLYRRGPARRVDARPGDAGLVRGGARLGPAPDLRAATDSTGRATCPSEGYRSLEAYVDPSWESAQDRGGRRRCAAS